MALTRATEAEVAEAEVAEAEVAEAEVAEAEVAEAEVAEAEGGAGGGAGSGSAGDHRSPSRAERAPARRGSRLLAFLSALGPLVGVVTGAVGTFYLVRPNLAPSTANAARITNVAVEPAVTLAEYAGHPTVARILGARHEEFLRVNASNAGTVGTVVHFDFEVVGYNRRTVATRWTLFEAGNGRRLGESERLEPLAFEIKEFEKKEADIGSWESWVHLPAATGRQVFVRLELFDEVVGLRLVFRDTPVFAMP